MDMNANNLTELNLMESIFHGLISYNGKLPVFKLMNYFTATCFYFSGFLKTTPVFSFLFRFNNN